MIDPFALLLAHGLLLYVFRRVSQLEDTTLDQASHHRPSGPDHAA